MGLLVRLPILTISVEVDMIGFVQILGGLALFLFGIRMLSGGMEKLAGDQNPKMA